MDFRDSPEEARLRARLRDWLTENVPSLPASSCRPSSTTPPTR
ncbi:hypothetical protein [Actinomadura sp. 7K507]|nr:hypothetical protein [Actinomadura sp. 7K507]